jgi:ABC-type transport system involved in multi-copper enzyme maturation permease subunit
VKPVVLGIILIIGLPIIGMIEAISWLNPYPFILATTVIQSGTIDWNYLAALLAVTIALTAADYVLFKKKEL